MSKTARLSAFAAASLLATALLGEGTAPSPSPLVDRIGKTAFVEVAAPSFAALPLDQKLVAYHLVQAAIQLDPIYYDQMATYALQAKRLLGAMVADPGRLPAASRPAIVEYAKLFFGNKGNHQSISGVKFVPELSYEAFAAAAEQARAGGAPLGSAADLAGVLRDLKAPLFDPAVEPLLTDKSPAAGKDLLTASSNNYYQGVRLADLQGFTEHYGIDSRLVKRDGRLVEEVWRAGTPDGKVPPGRYARELAAVNRELALAARSAAPAQAATLAALIRFYQTGEPADWRDFNILWLRDNPTVDFASGFIETYRDARGIKGSSQMLVGVVDQALDPLMHRLADNAVYFERQAPWEERFKKLDVKPPVGKALETVVATGDFSVGTIGDNLPNEQEIREKYGTKSLLLTSSMNVFDRVTNRQAAIEFTSNADAAVQFDRYGVTAENLLTAMHEVIGHGSGKVAVPNDPATYLREYYSTLEEARADLVAYWNITDPKLGELGIHDLPQVAHVMYHTLANYGLIALGHYPQGDRAEEDHDRDRLLICNYLIEAGALRRVQHGGHWYIDIVDFDRAHAAVGKLLAELMRIKATGDYNAIKALIDKYGIHFDPAVRDDVLARFAKLQRPSFWVGVFPQPRLDQDAAGHPTGVALGSTPFLAQELVWAKINGTLGFP
jgi:dipeptidyl-peptidase-3